MGTKRDPGNFDCYHAAQPDEPMFCLLARDLSAPELVQCWAQLRLEGIDAGKYPSSDRSKVEDALNCAAEMIKWRAARESIKQAIANATGFKAFKTAVQIGDMPNLKFMRKVVTLLDAGLPGHYGYGARSASMALWVGNYPSLDKIDLARRDFKKFGIPKGETLGYAGGGMYQIEPSSEAEWAAWGVARNDKVTMPEFVDD